MCQFCCVGVWEPVTHRSPCSQGPGLGMDKSLPYPGCVVGDLDISQIGTYFEYIKQKLWPHNFTYKWRRGREGGRG